MLLDCALYRTDGTVTPSDPEAALDEVRSETGAFVWANLLSPDELELEGWAREFGLHPLAVEDALHAHQRPKVELYGNTLFAVLKTARYLDSEEMVKIGEVMLFAGAQFVLTVLYQNQDLLEEARASLGERAAWGTGAILHAVIDDIVDRYAQVLEGLADDIDQVETQVFSTPRVSQAERIFRLKREALDFRRALFPLSEALEKLYSGQVSWIDRRLLPYFRDVHDHALRYSDYLETQDALLSSALTATAAQVGMRQSEDMRRISAWVAIMAVPTMIAGIYGMNFEYMPALSWRFGYPLVIMAMVAICTALYRVFRRLGWL